MALRYPLALEGKEWTIQSSLQTLRAERPAQPVQFRPEANMQAVAQEIVACRHVRLEASVGAGKSTRIPRALARETKALVFHVIPFRLAARQIFQYLTKQENSLAGRAEFPFELYGGDPEAVPRNGVLLMGAAEMVDFMHHHGGLSKFKSCTVFLDEAHECNAHTYILKHLSLAMGAARLVLASATFTPDEFRPRESLGSVQMIPVKIGARDAWSVSDPESPFYWRQARVGVSVFVDSRTDTKALHELYERAGLWVYQINAQTTDAEFDAAMNAMNDESAGVIALLLDYSARSALTLTTDRFVDLGRVGYQKADMGRMARGERPVFKFEREQGAGRAGRVPGQAKYFYRDEPCEPIMCDLEGVELEAAAYMVKCLGYEPFLDLKKATMAKEHLPARASIRTVLSGPHPITYVLVNPDLAILVPLVNDTPPAYSRGHETKMRGGVASMTDGQPVEKPESISSIREFGRQFLDMVEEVGTGADAAFEMPVGPYYISQVHDDEYYAFSKAAFPKGLDSVRRIAMHRDFLNEVRRMPSGERIYAFNLLLQRYNTLIADLRALKWAVDTVTSGAKVRSVACTAKAAQLLKAATDEYREAIECLAAAQVFAQDPSWYVMSDGRLDVEKEAADSYTAVLRDVIPVRSCRDLDRDIRGSVVDNVAKKQEFLTPPRDTRSYYGPSSGTKPGLWPQVRQICSTALPGGMSHQELTHSTEKRLSGSSDGSGSRSGSRSDSSGEPPPSYYSRRSRRSSKCDQPMVVRWRKTVIRYD